MKRKRGKQRVDHNLRNQESRKIQLCKCALKGAAVWTGICNLIMGHGVHCFNYISTLERMVIQVSYISMAPYLSDTILS